MTCVPTATRTRDLPLRRSFRVLRSTAVLEIRAGFLVVLVPLDVCGFHLVLAREWHAARPSMRTIGAPQDRTTPAASERCLRSCLLAVARPCRCPNCCTELTVTCQGVRPDSRRLRPLNWVLASSSRTRDRRRPALALPG